MGNKSPDRSLRVKPSLLELAHDIQVIHRNNILKDIKALHSPEKNALCIPITQATCLSDLLIYSEISLPVTVSTRLKFLLLFQSIRIATLDHFASVIANKPNDISLTSIIQNPDI